MFLQGFWDTMALQVRVNTSTVAWGVTAWSTMRPAKGIASAWITVNRTTSPCAARTGSCTRTTASSTGPRASEDTGSPSCTARSASTKVSCSCDLSLTQDEVWSSGFWESRSVPFARMLSSYVVDFLRTWMLNPVLVFCLTCGAWDNI